MTTTTTKPILVYTEATPNPETLKFVSNQMLLHQQIADFTDAKAAADSPLASALFEKPYVEGVFIASNFITITRALGFQWQEIIPELREFIKNYLAEDKPVVTDAWLAAQQRKRDEAGPADEGELEEKIKDILEKYVRPAVEMDGGAIIFRSFEKGIVTLELQGACSGCPSSTITLKSGIENMLKRMIPEVEEVMALEG